MPRALVRLYAIAFAGATSAGMVLLALPLVARALGASPQGVGLIGGLRALPGAALALPFGLLADRLGRTRALAIAALAGTAGAAVLAAAGSLSMVALGAMASGLAAGAFIPSVEAATGDVAPPGASGRAFGWLTLYIHLGFTLGPALAGVLAEGAAVSAARIPAIGFPGVFLLAGVMMAAVYPLALGLRPGAREADPPAGAWRALLRDRRVPALWLAVLGISSGWGAALILFPPFAVGVGLSAATVGLVLGVQSAANAASRLPLGVALDRVRNVRRVVVLSLAGYGAALLVLPRAATAAGFAAVLGGSVVLVAAVYIVAQIGLTAASTASTRGLAMGGYATAVLAGQGLGPVVGGAVAGAHGYEAGFAAVTLVCILSGMGYWALTSRAAAVEESMRGAS